MNEFGKLARAALIAIAFLSITGLIAAMFLGERFSSYESFQNDTYSYSALGHRLFFDLLKENEQSIERIEEEDRIMDVDASTWFIEPDVSDVEDRRRLGDTVWDDTYVGVVVLPKRRGEPDDDRRFIKRHSLVEGYQINDLLTQIGGDKVTRVENTGPVTVNVLGLPVPTIEGPIQLLQGDYGEPVFAYDAGVLITHVRSESSDFYVISDPDVLANHGLMEPNNLSFMSGFLNEVPKPIEIDETFHGYRKKPSFLRLITTFPFSIITIHFVILMILMTWSGLGQFGRRRGEEETIEYGPRGLIDNTAKLFEPKHAAYLGEKYIWQLVRGVADAVNAPEHLGRRALLEWLDELAARRGCENKISELVKEMEQMAMDLKKWTPRDVVQTVQAVNHWKLEILNERG